MNLSLLTALALAAAADAKLGGAPSFAEQLSFLQEPCADRGCAPDYCYPKFVQPDYACYKSGYPKCCTKNKGNCPNNVADKPGCECGGANCGGSEQDKGTRCERGDGTCKGDLFCQTPVGTCAGEGRCERMTVACDRTKLEVCGCNGVTYDNECEAFSVGVSVEYAAACGSTPAPTPHDWFPDGGACGNSCGRDSDCQVGGYNPCSRCGTQHGTIMYRRCYAPMESEQ